MDQYQLRHPPNDFSIKHKSEHSIFETMKVTEKGIEVPFFHWERMKNGGQILGIEVPEYPDWINHLEEYLSGMTGRPPFALRVSLTQAKETSSLQRQPPQWLFSTRDIPYTQEQYRKGVKIFFLQETRQDSIPLTTIKSPDYLDTGYALRNVEARGAFEGIWLNKQGELVEGTRSNIFFVRKGAVYTPSTASGCLEGTRRRIVKSLAYKLLIPFQEKDVFPQELFQAEEVFLTNALMGIMPVSQVENTPLSGPVTNSITAALIQSYKDI